jgi:hypothetical protein
MAAQIMEEAQLDATALYIEVRRWEPTPSDRGMKADGVIVALDVTMVDPKTGKVLWEVHRPSRPVPLYGVVLTGQANVFVAETVMRDVFARLGSKQPLGSPKTKSSALQKTNAHEARTPIQPEKA